MVKTGAYLVIQPTEALICGGCQHRKECGKKEMQENPAREQGSGRGDCHIVAAESLGNGSVDFINLTSNRGRGTA